MKKVGITPGPVKFDNMEPNDVKQFNPSNTGTEGQVLTKTNNGYNWQTPSSGGSDVGFYFMQSYPQEFYSADMEHADILIDDLETFNASVGYTITLYDTNGHSPSITGLTESIVFIKRAYSEQSSQYYATAALSCYDPSIGPGTYSILINGAFKANKVVGEDVGLEVGFYGTAMFSKTVPASGRPLQTINRVELTINSINLRVNQQV